MTVKTTDQRAVAAPGPTVAQLTAEFVGTALLLAAVVGSGIMADNLSIDEGLTLLQNAFATAGVLVALILAFGSVSGAHFNPVVTLTARLLGTVTTRTAAAYTGVQVAGAMLGVAVANVMFDLAVVEVSTKDRSAFNLVFSEAIATFGLILVILTVVRSSRPTAVAVAVGGYIAGAYCFTASTSFANPAVTLARMLSDTFTGIAPQSAPAFIAAQVIGAVAAAGVFRVMYPAASETNA